MRGLIFLPEKTNQRHIVPVKGENAAAKWLERGQVRRDFHRPGFFFREPILYRPKILTLHLESHRWLDEIDHGVRVIGYRG